MPSEKKIHKKLTQKLAARKLPPSDKRLYAETFIYSLIVLAVITAYYFVTRPEYDMRTFNRGIADLSFLLMGISLILSSVCYFWNFADHFIIYRKHLGLIGFGYMILHIVISLFYSAYQPFLLYYLKDSQIVSFSAALTATGIFTLMAVISNRFSIQKIGPHRWRLIMRVGYIAYVMALIHFALRGWPYWMLWLSGKSTSLFPSFGLLVFVFGCIVVLMRIVLFAATINKKE
ncbi:ferric reductase-like transmembrane domain-containing protein [Candidatus Roizmanbacteria bacterium]|nr:MAG: ferric reductase-like transmembrane domain-containing protein [Candidatus Roizmanbacteria bacterium]